MKKKLLMLLSIVAFAVISIGMAASINEAAYAAEVQVIEKFSEIYCGNFLKNVWQILVNAV